MIITGLFSDSFAVSRLIAFCAISENGDLDYCTKILNNTQNPTVFSWNVAIRGFSDSKNALESVVLYKKMLLSNGSKPDNYTFPFLFKVCAKLLLIRMGFEVLGHVMKLGLDQDLFVCNAVIHMLVSCGELGAAEKMFEESCARDLVSWNSLINGYVRSGRAVEALGTYRKMEMGGVRPDVVTMIGVVSSCAQLENLRLGRDIHQYIVENGLTLTIPLVNSLIDMYVKCGDLKAARELFDCLKNKTIVSWTTMVVGYAKYGFLDTARKMFEEMPEKDVVPWNAIIGGYIQAKRYKQALTLFYEMQEKNIKPDEITMLSCLSACSQLGALNVGIWVHHYIEKYQLSLNEAVGTALVDMYAKCGNITKALQVFQELPKKNSLTWTALIGGLALHGNAHAAISHFAEMLASGLMPDEITFLEVLSACCHSGLVEEGRKFFSEMIIKYNISPKLKHYSCMVDLLGRAGLLQEAEELINSMPTKADAVVWGALFFACRMHQDVERGKRVGSKLLELEPQDSGNYVLLANMYRDAKLWEEARKVRKMMVEKGVVKTPGCSSIEVNGIVNEFIVRDNLHPLSEQIYGCLIQLTRHLEVDESQSGLDVLPEYPFFVSEFGYLRNLCFCINVLPYCGLILLDHLLAPDILELSWGACSIMSGDFYHEGVGKAIKGLGALIDVMLMRCLGGYYEWRYAWMSNGGVDG
ncbi:Pentatricopeptide repeat [Dillenia turbinata]|uniref:Pentatricopeptide repeat n=1 Tax=Dillenia turbinata TaxID=194707 RepID=A0AAN8VN38_9MAGN